MSPVDVEAAWLSLRMQLAAHRPDRATRELTSERPPTPVCLLTGFLGAGKSVLVADLLADPPEALRIKAIVNDVGALPFDPTLIDSADDVRVELTNGCGCCERTAELAQALASFADDPACDLIVLEASGAADPLGIAQVIAADPTLRLERIVTVVTAAHLTTAVLPDPLDPVLHRQIDSAHCVIVSGCDLVEAPVAAAAVERASRLAPGRTVTASSIGALATRVLVPTAPRGARPAPGGDEAVHRELAIATLEPRHEPTMAELVAVLEACRPGLLRAKGRLVVDGQQHLVQLTPLSIDIVTAPPGPLGLTVIAVQRADAQPLIDLLGARAAPEQKAART